MIFSQEALMPIDESRAAQAIKALLESFEADPESLELRATPGRVAAFWQERLAGYDIDLEAELKALPGDLVPCPVILERIPFVSTCEHHLAPFEGTVTLGYVPSEGGTVGLSKLVRVVQAYAWRLQVQERMTRQIAEALEQYLSPTAWGVKVVAEHTCMSHRGVKTSEVPVTTVILGGDWTRNPPALFR